MLDKRRKEGGRERTGDALRLYEGARRGREGKRGETPRKVSDAAHLPSIDSRSSVEELNRGTKTHVRPGEKRHDAHVGDANVERAVDAQGRVDDAALRARDHRARRRGMICEVAASSWDISIIS